MYRIASRLSVVALLIPLCSAPKLRADEPTPTVALAAKLREVKKFNGFDDPKTTLQEALDQIMRAQDLTIEVDEEAFKSKKVMDVRMTPIADPNPLPEFTGTLAMMLNKICTKIPVPSGATFIIRPGHIEITTRAAMMREFYRDRPAKAPLPPLVHASIVNEPLSVALRNLTRNHGGNVVVDARVGKEAQTPVTADFTNVPLDNAVLLLADMTGLTTIEVGNVLYVTTRDNGRALQLERERRSLKGPDKLDPSK